MMKHYFIFLCLLFVYSFSSAQTATENIKFSGAFFGDYFYNINHFDPAKADLNGFQFRRIFVTADMYLSDKLDSRFRLEGKQDSESVLNGEKIGVYIKDASLRWKNIFEGSDLVFGLSPTPAWMITQEAWYYRSVEKTPMDLFGISLSRDIGIDLKGKIAGDGSINYWIKIGNNSGQSIETNKYKRFYSLIQYKPNSNFMTTIFADYAAAADKIDPYDGKPKSNNKFVGSWFVNYKQKRNYSIGAETFYIHHQNNYADEKNGNLVNQDGFGFSLWGWLSLNDKFRAILRFDRYNSNTQNENQSVSFCVAGLDYIIDPAFSIIPNIEYFNYQNQSAYNLIARITFSYRFNELILVD